MTHLNTDIDLAPKGKNHGEAAMSEKPVMYVSEQQLDKWLGDYLPTRKEAEGNFQLALYRKPDEDGWTKVPDEPDLAFLRGINRDNQVLVYENGRFYNAWFEFEQSEGGWFWTDDADSEPNPSHFMALPSPPKPSSEPTP